MKVIFLFLEQLFHVLTKKGLPIVVVLISVKSVEVMEQASNQQDLCCNKPESLLADDCIKQCDEFLTFVIPVKYNLLKVKGLSTCRSVIWKRWDAAFRNCISNTVIDLKKKTTIVHFNLLYCQYWRKSLSSFLLSEITWLITFIQFRDILHYFLNRVSGEYRFRLQCRMAMVPQGNMFSLMDLLMIVIEEILIVSDVNIVTAL